MKTIFVSSTFRDMQAERDILKSVVQPRLNDTARKYGDSVSFSDLRWGVDTTSMDEAEQNRRVLSVCLNEIDRARPNMIVLLGERYGYMPGESVIRKEVRKRPGFRINELDISVTQLEIEYGALSSRESLRNTFFYFRELDADTLPAGFREEYEQSRSKLETLKRRIRDLAGDRVRFYKASWNGSRVTGLEEFSDMVFSDLQGQFLPQWEQLSRQNIVERTDSIQKIFIQEKMRAFKKVTGFNSSFLRDLFEYKEIMFPSDYRIEFGDVMNRLRYMFAGRPKGLGAVMTSTRTGLINTRILAEEMHGRIFKDLERKREVQILRGPSGTGRTMTALHVARVLEKAGFRVIEVYAGSTSMLSDTRGILLYIIYHMEEIMHKKHRYLGAASQSVDEYLADLSIDEALDYMNGLVEWFSKSWLRYRGRRIAIIVDGVENIRKDIYRDRFNFVMEKITEQVKVLYTCDESIEIPHSEKSGGNVLSRFEPTVQELYSLVDGALEIYGKQLSEEIKAGIVAKCKTNNPLYINMAVARLTLMDADDFARIAEAGDGIEAINSYLSSIIDTFPETLEEMAVHLLNAAGEMIDGPMMKEATRFLTVSRAGLRPEDLTALLAKKGYNLTDLAFVQFVNYMSDLFIVRENGCYDFMHSCIRNGVHDSMTPEEYYSYIEALRDHLASLPADDPLRESELLIYDLFSEHYEHAAENISKLNNASPFRRSAAANDILTFLQTDTEENSFFAAAAEYSKDHDCSDLFDFLSRDVLPYIGETRNDSITRNGLIDLIYDNIGAVRDGSRLSDIYLRLAQTLTDLGASGDLQEAWHYADEAVDHAYDIDAVKKLRALTACVEISQQSDAEEPVKYAEEARSELKKAIGEVSAKDEDPYVRWYLLRARAAVCRAEMKDLSLTEAQEAVKILDEIHSGLLGLREEIPSRELDSDIAQSATTLADMQFLINDDKNRKLADRHYEEAFSINSTHRDREKDMKSYLDFTISAVRLTSFRSSLLDKHWGLFSFLKKEDTDSERKYWLRELSQRAKELGTVHVHIMLYRLLAQTGGEEEALGILENLGDRLPFCDTERLDCEQRYLHKRWNYLINTRFTDPSKLPWKNDQEKDQMYNEVYKQIRSNCATVDEYLQSGKLKDETLRMLYYQDLSDVHLAMDDRKHFDMTEKDMAMVCDHLRKRAKEKDTVKSIIDLEEALRLYGLILDTRNGEGDLEAALDCYLEMKELRKDVVRGHDARIYAYDFTGYRFFLLKTRIKLRNRNKKQ